LACHLYLTYQGLFRADPTELPKACSARRARDNSTFASAALPATALRAVPFAAMWLCCASGFVQAQNTVTVPVADPAVQLKNSPKLQESLPDDDKRQVPTFVMGDRITGRPDLDTVVEGHAELRRSGMFIRADRIDYYQPDDLAKARGSVVINREGNVYTGSEAQMKLDSTEGYLQDPTYQFLRNAGYGQGSRIDFLDDKKSVLRNATYTTCTRKPGPSWMPDWILKAAQINFDTDTDVGQAQDVQLRFKDIPILSLPAMSFPLSDARKSGWLPPTLNIDNTSGTEVVLPYYLNIAPNRDATLYTSLMTKRGLNFGTEFRYLEDNYSGNARFDFMPSDRLRDSKRWGLGATHSGQIKPGILAGAPLNLNLTLNRVSDNDYWRDFPRATSGLTSRLLAADGNVSWASGPLSLSLRALKWQTLQVPEAIITPPFDRLPQLTAVYNRPGWSGLGSPIDVTAELDTTRFRSQKELTGQPNGQRTFAALKASKSWTEPGYFLTPKLQLHASRYALESPLSNGESQAQRVVPTASLDGGLIFERSANFFGRNFLQTLEPRALLAYTPYRDQSALPNYDSGANDFNFSSIYNENSFVGNDRFADNNLMTLGLTSRLLDKDTGAEAVRLAFAQRVRFSDQKVTLPGGLPDTARFSDMLFGANVNWSPQWSTDAIVQYNPKTQLSERSTLSARYSPSNYRTLSAAYRFTREQNEQVDLGWQWPVNDLWGDKGKDLGAGAGQGEGRWYSVGRLNYNLRDKKIVDTVVGFEYDAGCWLGRVVLERLQTTNISANKRIFFQLEFVGFTRLGSNPLPSLRDNVPRYQYLRDKTFVVPSRYSTYD
jgi:LPS-assembly protein